MAKQALIEKYIKRLEGIDDQDPEYGHMKADKVLCDLLIELDYDFVVAEYQTIKKFYV
jgi:hypothetical protein